MNIVEKKDTRKKDKATRGVFRHQSGEWAIRYQCGLGHVHEQKIGRDKTQAKDEHSTRRLRVRQDPAWCPRSERVEARAAAERRVAERVTLQAYAEKWLVANRPHWRPTTHEKYSRAFDLHIYPSLGGKALVDITRAEVRSLLSDKRVEGLALNTINNAVLVPLRALFYAALDDGKVPTNPATRHMRHIRASTEKDARTVDFLSDEELTVLLTTADADYPQHADFLHVLALTGLREGEGCGLQWGDVDFRGGFLEVRRNVLYRADPEQRRKGVKRRDRKPILDIGAPKSGESARVDMGPSSPRSPSDQAGYDGCRSRAEWARAVPVGLPGSGGLDQAVKRPFRPECLGTPPDQGWVTTCPASRSAPFLRLLHAPGRRNHRVCAGPA